MRNYYHPIVTRENTHAVILQVTFCCIRKSSLLLLQR